MSRNKPRKQSPGKQESRQDGFVQSFRRIMKANWPLFKVYLLFGLTLLILFTVIIVPPVYERVIDPMNSFLAWSSAAVIGLFAGDDLIIEGSSISSDSFAINIAEGCNGVYALSIILAGIIAFPARWRTKGLGVLIATVFIMTLNYVRILTLWYAGQASLFLFDAMHLYVWEFVIIALGVGLWYYWYEKYAKE